MTELEIACLAVMDGLNARASRMDAFKNGDDDIAHDESEDAHEMFMITASLIHARFEAAS